MEKIVQEGKRLQLRQAVEADLDYITEADHRPGNAEFVMADTRETHARLMAGPDTMQLIVERKDTREAVGFLLIAGLTSPDKEMEWRRVIIDAKGQGYGHETMELVEAWAFETMKFHRAWLDCKDYNARALHVYEAAGMQREALLRETILVNGHYENLVIMAILDREYFARKKAAGKDV